MPNLHRTRQGARRFGQRRCGVLVVGNPANTNAWIAMKSARAAGENFTAMLRLDHNRALSQLAAKTGKPVASIDQLAVWGNHSPTMYADYRFATIEGRSVKDTIGDHAWNRDVFLPTVGKRGAAIIEARGLSSAASAANAAIDHMHDWALGTDGGWNDGRAEQRRIRHPKDVSSVPGDVRRRQVHHRRGPADRRLRQAAIDKTLAELTSEQDGVKHLL